MTCQAHVAVRVSEADPCGHLPNALDAANAGQVGELAERGLGHRTHEGEHHVLPHRAAEEVLHQVLDRVAVEAARDEDGH